MALTDLLWACPECGEIGGLQEPEGPQDTCSACGCRFERAAGATIRCTRPDGDVVVRSAADWVDRLPDPSALLDGVGAGEVARSARVRARAVSGSDQVRGEDGYLNRIERYGPERHGVLELTPDGLRWTPDREAAGWWPFETLTAVQGSSSALQLKRADHPLVSFRFDDDSIFLWERLVDTALTHFYRRTGRGEILEFQPRIVTGR